ncbi:MAG: amino acid ABC transporter substrate-binding protein, partial [Natronospirillum sp.]
NNGSDSREVLFASLREVASARGEQILHVEWEKARQLIADGQDINYVGASGDHEFDANGDVPGAVEELVVRNGQIVSEGFLDL